MRPFLDLGPVTSPRTSSSSNGSRPNGTEAQGRAVFETELDEADKRVKGTTGFKAHLNPASQDLHDDLSLRARARVMSPNDGTDRCPPHGGARGGSLLGSLGNDRVSRDADDDPVTPDSPVELQQLAVCASGLPGPLQSCGRLGSGAPREPGGASDGAPRNPGGALDGAPGGTVAAGRPEAVSSVAPRTRHEHSGVGPGRPASFDRGERLPPLAGRGGIRTEPIFDERAPIDALTDRAATIAGTGQIDREPTVSDVSKPPRDMPSGIVAADRLDRNTSSSRASAGSTVRAATSMPAGAAADSRRHSFAPGPETTENPGSRTAAGATPVAGLNGRPSSNRPPQKAESSGVPVPVRSNANRGLSGLPFSERPEKGETSEIRLTASATNWSNAATGSARQAAARNIGTEGAARATGMVGAVGGRSVDGLGTNYSRSSGRATGTEGTVGGRSLDELGPNYARSSGRATGAVRAARAASGENAVAGRSLDGIGAMHRRSAAREKTETAPSNGLAHRTRGASSVLFRTGARPVQGTTEPRSGEVGVNDRSVHVKTEIHTGSAGESDRLVHGATEAPSGTVRVNDRLEHEKTTASSGSAASSGPTASTSPTGTTSLAGTSASAASAEQSARHEVGALSPLDGSMIDGADPGTIGETRPGSGLRRAPRGQPTTAAAGLGDGVVGPSPDVALAKLATADAALGRLGHPELLRPDPAGIASPLGSHGTATGSRPGRGSEETAQDRSMTGAPSHGKGADGAAGGAPSGSVQTARSGGATAGEERAGTGDRTGNVKRSQSGHDEALSGAALAARNASHPQATASAGLATTDARTLPPALVHVAKAILDQESRSNIALRLRLDHGELGGIEISLRRGHSGLVVELRADLHETSRLLTSGAVALARELRSSGLGLESVNVSDGNHLAAGGQESAPREGGAYGAAHSFPAPEKPCAADPPRHPHTQASRPGARNLDLRV